MNENKTKSAIIITIIAILVIVACAVLGYAILKKKPAPAANNSKTLPTPKTNRPADDEVSSLSKDKSTENLDTLDAGLESSINAEMQ